MRIVILGLGHIGSWLARELSGENQVAAFDVAPLTIDDEAGFAVIDGPQGIEAFNPELLINAVSLQHTIQAFEEVKPYLGQGCVISDVASIKGRIADYYRSSPFPFASIHPMFGPTYTTMGRVSEENGVIITESCEMGRLFFEKFFNRLGVRLFHYSFDEHDRMMAYSLTTPFVSSMVFAACVNAMAVPGTTFSRHMTLARNLLAEDEHLLAEILFNPYSIAELNRITSRLEFLKHIIAARDEEEIAAFLKGLRTNIGRDTYRDGGGEGCGDM